MKILVTGATGHFGRKVVETLLETLPTESLAVSVRNPEKVKDLRTLGIEVRQGDFNNPASLDVAFAGADRLLIVSTQGDNDTRIDQHLTAISAAKRAGVGFIAYTSVANADKNPLFLAPVHRATEEAIRKTGIPYSFLRNNWYIENEMGAIQGVLAGAPLVVSAGAGKVGWAARNDYAQAAAAVLAGSGHENTIYELSGTPITYEELAVILEQVLNTKIAVQQVSDEEYGRLMANTGIPEQILPILIAIQSSIRKGALNLISKDLQTLLGRPQTPLSDVIRNLVKK